MIAERYKLGSLEKMSDKHDERNFQFSKLQTDAPPATFMDAVNFLDSIRARKIAQAYGDCTSFGGKRCKDWSEKKVMSAHFLYHAIKEISGRYDDEGDYPINAHKALCTVGICEEAYHPTVPDMTWQQYAKREPSAAAIENALMHKSRTYWEVQRGTLEEFKRAMGIFQTPVNIAMEVYTSYLSCPADGHLPLPSGSMEGGHSLSGEGYESVTGQFYAGRIWLGNSWGENWGLKGRAWIPFEEFGAHNFTSCFVNLDIDKNMIYKINRESGEQFLIEENLKIALNISNVAMLQKLQGRGLKEEPMDISEAELSGYLICPLTDRDSVSEIIKSHYNGLADVIGVNRLK